MLSQNPKFEDTVAGFLGVHINQNNYNGSIKITQTGLEKRIIKVLDIGQIPRNFTPSPAKPLVEDEESDP